MSKNILIDELQKNKNEATTLLQEAEATLGHAVLTKKDKTISKEDIEVYNAFNNEIALFHELKNNIIALDKEHAEIKEEIAALKESQLDKQKEISSMHLEIGEALFDNYSPIISDVFGKTYTSVCIENRKIREAKEKEASYSDQSESHSFFSKVFTMAKAGASKTKASLYEQKRENLLSTGAKKALEGGTLFELLQTESFSDNARALLETYKTIQKDLVEQAAHLDTLILNENAVKTSLEKAGVSLSVQKRLTAIDKSIEEKHIEQNDFCVDIGHEYAIRYVSPDGESLVSFPKSFESILADIQDRRLEIMSISRQIEIETISQRIVKIGSENEKLDDEKSTNSVAIEKLRSENEKLDATIVQNNEEKQELEKKLALLKKEEEKK